MPKFTRSPSVLFTYILASALLLSGFFILTAPSGAERTNDTRATATAAILAGGAVPLDTVRELRGLGIYAYPCFGLTNCSGTYSAIRWTWDDGSTTDDATPGGAYYHIYPQTGEYTVTLHLYDAMGATLDTDAITLLVWDYVVRGTITNHPGTASHVIALEKDATPGNAPSKTGAPWAQRHQELTEGSPTNILAHTSPSGTSYSYQTFILACSRAWLYLWLVPDASPVYSFAPSGPIGSDIVQNIVVTPTAARLGVFLNSSLTADAKTMTQRIQVDSDYLSPQFRIRFDVWAGAYAPGCTWGDGELTAAEGAALSLALTDTFIRDSFGPDYVPPTSASWLTIDGAALAYDDDSITGHGVTGAGVYNSASPLVLAWSASYYRAASLAAGSSADLDYFVLPNTEYYDFSQAAHLASYTYYNEFPSDFDAMDGRKYYDTRGNVSGVFLDIGIGGGWKDFGIYRPETPADELPDGEDGVDAPYDAEDEDDEDDGNGTGGGTSGDVDDSLDGLDLTLVLVVAMILVAVLAFLFFGRKRGGR